MVIKGVYRFGKMCGNVSRVSIIITFLLIITSRVTKAVQRSIIDDRQTVQQPHLNKQGLVYADLDTSNQRVFLVLKSGLWSYDLANEQWDFLDSLQTLPGQLNGYEFGYNPVKNRIQFWSKGVGKLFEMQPKHFKLDRVDNSFDHKNQFNHFAFYKNDTLFTFGGYGFWRWKNIITFYNDDIDEWNSQNIDIDSPFPEGRVPQTGTYVPSMEKLYIFGGISPEKGRPDDQFTGIVFRRDIWSYSFKTNTWEKVLELPESNFEMYKVLLTGKEIKYTNVMTSSFYDPNSGYWFIPFTEKMNPNVRFYLKPIQPEQGEAYKEIQLKFGNSNQFLPTNFLYNEVSNNVLVVGIDNLSNSDRFPVKIIKIPVTTLLEKIESRTIWTEATTYYYLTGVVVFLLIITFTIPKNKVRLFKYSSDQHIHYERIKEVEFLNEEEKKLLKYFFQTSQDLESQQIEDLLWEHIDNYDYKRRLRNDIIKSINRKYRDQFDADAELILRNKDPNDKRRYLYSLNDELVVY